MPSSSLIKYLGQPGSDGNDLLWGRADVDGAPFRNQAGLDVPQLMSNEEADERLVRVQDVYNRLFDLAVPEENKAYLAVLDKIVNNWAVLTFRQHYEFKTATDVKLKVYVEWTEPVMMDGKPNLSQRPYLARPNDE